MSEPQKPIADYDEFREELSRLRALFERVEAFMEDPVVESGIRFAMDAEERIAARYQKKLNDIIPPSNNSFAPAPLNVARPSSPTGARLIDRVEQVLRESGVAMKPKDVVTEYQRRGWPPPEKGKIYDGITSTMAYLCKNKGKLVKTESGYVHVNNLPVSNGTSEKSDPLRGF